ncbi:Flp pilus assembly complex ATPase component TadA [Paenibacillus lactis]|uniref:ATPase, T2SS/T4P/T4SS family n=1 Tax=Paenibacillus lactis TaxID=228574 RepID=UPI00203C684F|nr:ATPase, T2SS/T4P/T4SS family [Paenibacillus lactis]MCM3495043.1 Flp pilus assembly complex ATPase component TadA [Paenibacillus lactis]
MLLGSAMNMVWIIVILLFLLLLVYLRYLERKGAPSAVVHDTDPYSIPAMTAFVKETLHQLTHSQLSDLGLHEEEYRRRLNKRSELRRALKGCVTGDVLDKAYVKDFMKELLVKYLGVNETNIDQAIPFEHPAMLTPQDQFEIILYLYKQNHGQDALSMLLETYDLARPRVLPGYGNDSVYAVTADDIAYIYESEQRPLRFQEKLDIVVQRIYQEYKGFSVIDELRDQRIDGVSGGVSGVLEDSRMEAFPYGHDGFGWWRGNLEQEQQATGCESVWVFYRGISLHLSFLSFGSMLELKRVCQNIYKYNHPGQLSEASGYKVNEMKDGSRVVVVRPPFAESWAFFVRKFDLPKALLDQLITGDGSELAVGLLQYLMKGSRITAITGAQGSGKTTLLMAMVGHIYATYTLRVQEMAFELHLRKIYSRRNILSFRETEHITGQAGLDLQKKTDGTVNILGEVASDEVAAWMIQMSQVASLFTVFTHHAKTFKDLVQSLRNSLLKSGVFRQERIAEEQVAGVINFDIHLKRDAFGNRYIERITECIPLDRGIHRSGRLTASLNIEQETMEGQPEPELQLDDAGACYISRNVIEYRNGAYVPAARLTDRSIREMTEQMQPEDASRFRAFLAAGWGESVGT